MQMTIKELSDSFRKHLKNQYAHTEIDSFIDIVFKALLGYKHYELILQANEILPDKITEYSISIIEQLKKYRPIQYILGYTEFYGLQLKVNESVLIPRPETEELIKWILDESKMFSGSILDIGSGSGCIAIALAKFLPDSKVTGVDISEDALKISKKNAALNKVKVEFHKIDILMGTFQNTGKFDIIVSNPPYVTYNQKNSMEPNVVIYEPHTALFVPDEDPLVFYSAITRFAKGTLSRNGLLFFEINEEFADKIVELLSFSGFSAELRKDINGKDRMIKAAIK